MIGPILQHLKVNRVCVVRFPLLFEPFDLLRSLESVSSMADTTLQHGGYGTPAMRIRYFSTTVPILQHVEQPEYPTRRHSKRTSLPPVMEAEVLPTY